MDDHSAAIDAALSQADPATRDAFLERFDLVESPAQRHVIAHHVLAGDLAAALMVLAAPAGLYRLQDQRLCAAFLLGAAAALGSKDKT